MKRGNAGRSPDRTVNGGAALDGGGMAVRAPPAVAADLARAHVSTVATQSNVLEELVVVHDLVLPRALVVVVVGDEVGVAALSREGKVVAPAALEVLHAGLRVGADVAEAVAVQIEVRGQGGGVVPCRWKTTERVGDLAQVVIALVHRGQVGAVLHSGSEQALVEVEAIRTT